MSVSHQRAARRVFLAATAVLATACSGGDERTEQVMAGMSRDSALAVLGGGSAGAPSDSAGADSLRNIWRRTAYLVDGKNIEVLWYSSKGERWAPADTVPEGRIVPVVLVDGQVVGVGRSAYDRVAEAYRLPPNRY